MSPESQRAGHLVGLKRRGGCGADVAARLAARTVFVSVRGDSIRVSPHLYITAPEVDRLLEELDALVQLTDAAVPPAGRAASA